MDTVGLGWGRMFGAGGTGEFITAVAQLHGPYIVELLFSTLLNCPCLLAPCRLWERNWWRGGASFIPVKWAMFHFECSLSGQWVKRKKVIYCRVRRCSYKMLAFEKVRNIWRFVGLIIISNTVVITILILISFWLSCVSESEDAEQRETLRL